ncbi:hypothetical protein [Desulfomonile tiedjei]|uniref:Uncharacterized protein n=1 Tax=Desulfomonile tiedjei (strain ATCC 49306 / DSM 6799 / DCB-1) TaxID=706587 RepID=I4C0H5_DESTA|nr:hypothetical protein [Desulfomonile tiedjei]AFM23066.1 hypothetical protein Desti_0327 [Desulfomonile tiedjei DSM 6799]
MRTLRPFFIAVIIALVHITPLAAQDAASSKFGQLPLEVCRAITVYVADIETAKAESAKTKRTQQYDQARAKLETILKQYGKAAVLPEALKYADYTEETVTRNSSDPKFEDFTEKRIKTRGLLLDMCSQYTLTR